MNHFLMFLKRVWEDIGTAVLVVFILTVALAGLVLLVTTTVGDTSRSGLIAKHISFWIFVPAISGLLCYGSFRLGLKLYHYFKKAWTETGAGSSFINVAGNNVFVDHTQNIIPCLDTKSENSLFLVEQEVDTDWYNKARFVEATQKSEKQEEKLKSRYDLLKEVNR